MLACLLACWLRGGGSPAGAATDCDGEGEGSVQRPVGGGGRGRGNILVIYILNFTVTLLYERSTVTLLARVLCGFSSIEVAPPASIIYELGAATPPPMQSANLTVLKIC